METVVELKLYNVVFVTYTYKAYSESKYRFAVKKFE